MVDVHATTECAGCDWERHAKAFHWFPELGPPVRTALPARDAPLPALTRTTPDTAAAGS